MRLKRLFWILIGLGVLLAAGFASTRSLVGDGLERFVGEERAAAQDALISAHFGCLDNPIGRAVIPKIQVVEVQFAPGHCSTMLSLPTWKYLVVLRAYTLFLVPVATISVCDGEVDCRG